MRHSVRQAIKVSTFAVVWTAMWLLLMTVTGDTCPGVHRLATGLAAAGWAVIMLMAVILMIETTGDD